ncbi:MAG: hypothetical protein AAGE01_09025 [Pseudomonadota bacterium]
MTQWDKLDLGGLRLAMRMLRVNFTSEIDRMIETIDSHGFTRQTTGLRIRTANGTVFLVDAEGHPERFKLIAIDRRGTRQVDEEPRGFSSAIKETVLFLGDQEPRDESGTLQSRRHDREQSPRSQLVGLVVFGLCAAAMVLAFMTLTGGG